MAPRDPSTLYGLATSPNGHIEMEEKRNFSFDKERHRQKCRYSWIELNRLEQRRRAILKRVELPFRRIIFYWDGTCLRALSRDWLIWITIVLYVFIRTLAWLDMVPRVVDELGSRDTGVLGGFLSFFLVLFVNQTNSRFNSMYMESMSCEKFITDIASIATTSFPRANALRIVRYLNAAHVAGYTGLSKIYSKASFFDEINRRLKLLTPREMMRMDELDMDNGSDAAREILTWCMREVKVARQKGYIEPRDASGLSEKVLGLGTHMDNLYAYTDQPVHFYYIHFLCLLSALYLPLFALSSAYSAGFGEDMHVTTDLLLGLIVLLQAFFVIGLRLLGQQMVDPYGDDLEDLSVLYYVWSTAGATKNILNAQYPDEVDPQEEENLARGQAPFDTSCGPSEHFPLNPDTRPLV